MSDHGCFKCGADNPEFCIADSGDWEPGTYRAGLCLACAEALCPSAVIAYQTERAEIEARHLLWKAKWVEERDRMIHKPRRNLKAAVERVLAANHA